MSACRAVHLLMSQNSRQRMTSTSRSTLSVCLKSDVDQLLIFKIHSNENTPLINWDPLGNALDTIVTTAIFHEQYLSRLVNLSKGSHPHPVALYFPCYLLTAIKQIVWNSWRYPTLRHPIHTAGALHPQDILAIWFITLLITTHVEWHLVRDCG